MKTLYSFTVILSLSFFLFSFNRIENNNFKYKKASNHSTVYRSQNDVNEISNGFFKRYSDLKKYKSDIMSLYKTRTLGTIWFDEDEINEFGSVLYEKAKKTNDLIIPYQKEIDQLFSASSDKSTLSQTDADMLLSSLYIVYTKKSNADKKKLAYNDMLKDFLNYSTLEEQETTAIATNEKVEFDQYYKLQDALKKYKRLEKSSKYRPIVPEESPYKELRPDAVSSTIAQVRTRLYLLGDLKTDSKSNVYDRELMDAVMKYKVRNGFKPNYILAEEHINEMNIPLEDKLTTLKLNMERCREISAKIAASDEYVLVNVPSYELIYVKNGKVVLTSPVFVGAPLTKTTIFNGEIDRIVFSPYWTVPQSIVQNELRSKMAEDPNYLEEKNMEMVNGQVRQKPGPDNSLGLVKFVFPNPDDIYMHDTPSKTLFDFEKRTFSHGCINVKMAKELAVAMLKDYPEWTQAKIDKAMDGKVENSFKLTKKVPIFITYFTSLVNEKGEVGFFQDVYEKDANPGGETLPGTAIVNQ
ncbi:L,D-transpeptidase family protein [Flavobacterium nitrogenifigens]|uniref:Murein L,D-transpeptidase YcbB/YkuD n=1 Tax=Flavobacterium nitrogenifigens TaxID=1617283 RepID=A0A521AN57_9FLAO|nr:L,D-transpeptidase family protein [Flavobacterium nitrogenifigens]KAF2339057.1 L,D-transpeptidase family protein [Flavobacterium nitrogenifigens]SMO36201.1 Murein L,D-transpeptidase YcbB/YkuD [Flavobacterium nitrogenifigens]